MFSRNLTLSWNCETKGWVTVLTRPCKAISKLEEEMLWKSGQLGSETPQAIINTLWFYLTQHFGLRGRQEHVTMMI